MGFTKWLGTTAKPPIPKGLYEEFRQKFLRDIQTVVEKYNIPPELIFNADQTPTSYVSVGRSTMAKKGSKSVAIEGLNDKRNITLTFVATLDDQFLPLQIIYGGKTSKSLPRGFKFPNGFLLAQNPKHWSNESETLKLVYKVIDPYVVEKRRELKLSTTQKALVIWDVFKGQMTDAVKENLHSLHLELVPVPANMTHLFQPLDLTVNGAAKSFMRKQFCTYYSSEVKKQLQSGKQLEDVEIDSQL